MSKDSSQTRLPPIFQDITRDITQAEIISSFPVNTFLENIAIDDIGDLYTTSLEEGVIYHIGIEGEKVLFAKINGQLAGIHYLGERHFLLNGWDHQGIKKDLRNKHSTGFIPLLKAPLISKDI